MTGYTDDQRAEDEKHRRTIVSHLYATIAFAVAHAERPPVPELEAPSASSQRWACTLRDLLGNCGMDKAADRLVQWIVSPTHMVRPGDNGDLTSWLMARWLVPAVERDELPAFLAHAAAFKGSRSAERLAAANAEIDEARKCLAKWQDTVKDLDAELADTKRRLAESEAERQRLVAAAAEFDDDDTGGLVFDEPEAIDPPVPIAGMATAGTTADGVLAQIVCSTEGVLVTLRGGMSSGWSWHGTTAELRAIIEREHELTALGKRLAQLDAGLANVETKRRQLLADSADLRAELVQRCEGKTF